MDSTHGQNAAFKSIKEVNAGSYLFNVNYAQALNGVLCPSPKFTFGGHDWSLIYVSSISKNSVLLFPKILSETEGVKATFDLSLLNKDGTPSLKAFKRASYTSVDPLVVRRNYMEKEYLVEGCFFVLCSIFIPVELFREPPKSQFQLHEDLDNLLKSRDTTDITFEVDGEIFHAHKTILTARSSVFKAELFGSMAEAKSKCIKIEDMQPIVFKGLLSFMYTDSFEEDDLVVQHLLVAADRYALDGLRVMCEERLCKNISLETVLSCLALAERHNCNRLKYVCLHFAVKPENLLQLTLTDEYLQFMQDCPSVFSELRVWANCSGAFKEATQKAKRQRT